MLGTGTGTGKWEINRKPNGLHSLGLFLKGAQFHTRAHKHIYGLYGCVHEIIQLTEDDCINSLIAIYMGRHLATERQ